MSTATTKPPVPRWWRALVGASLYELALIALAIALHLGAASLALRLLLADKLNAPTPKLLSESLELTLAETESLTPTEASAPIPQPQTQVAAAPIPTVAPYLFDDASDEALLEQGVANPDIRRDPLSTIPSPDPHHALTQSSPPPIPRQAPPADLPEITLPPPQTLPAPKAQAATGATARIENPRLLTDLSRLLKRYPPEARRNNWEGSVVLELTIDAKGRLAGATIHRSSGYDVLDNAALKMIRSARFEGGPGTLLQPITYRLR